MAHIEPTPNRFEPLSEGQPALPTDKVQTTTETPQTAGKLTPAHSYPAGGILTPKPQTRKRLDGEGPGPEEACKDQQEGQREVCDDAGSSGVHARHRERR